jgi:glutaredoxin
MYLSYVNHLGEHIDFYGDSPFILAEHNLFDWQLTYETAGGRSSGFKLESREFSLKIRIVPKRFKGKDRPQAFSQLINHFVSVVSADTQVPGKMYARSGEYLEGKIIISNKSDWHVDKSVTLSCQFLADNPVWQCPHVHEFKSVDQSSYEFLGYPHGYPYDYAAVMPGYQTVNNSSTEASDYVLTIHGPVSSPLIYLNGISVGAYVTLSANDTLVINSRDKTVQKISGNVTSNEFNKRYKGPVSMFSKLEPGVVTAIWSGNFDFDLSIIEQRREPLWMI